MTEVICLTPVRNEAWILDCFLRAASLWADRIIVADQGSKDGSKSIAQRHPTALPIDNRGRAYNEANYRRVLLNAARKIARHSLLISLDADELLSANWRESEEWQKLQEAPNGTVIHAQFVNVLPDLRSCWLDEYKPIGLVDDGVSEYPRLPPMHLPRVPRSTSGPNLVLGELKVLHLQYIDWARMESKHRWYQCWERIHSPSKRPIQIYRQYHRHSHGRSKDVEPLRREWTRGHEMSGIGLDAIARRPPYYWDREVLELINRYGERRFSKLDIWDVDWGAIARDHGRPLGAPQDPRRWHERYVHRWLRETQGLAHRKSIRYMQRGLRCLGW